MALFILVHGDSMGMNSPASLCIFTKINIYSGEIQKKQKMEGIKIFSCWRSQDRKAFLNVHRFWVAYDACQQVFTPYERWLKEERLKKIC